MMKDKCISIRVNSKDAKFVKKLGYGLTETWELGVQQLREQEPYILKEKISYHKSKLDYYVERIKNLAKG